MWAGLAMAANNKNQHVLFNKRKDNVAHWRENLLKKLYVPKYERADPITIATRKQKH